MIFIDGTGIFAGIMLLMTLGSALVLLAVGQVIRALMLPGWRKLLYPAQTGLGIGALVITGLAPLLLYPMAIASLVLTWLTRREDQDLKWFATLSGLVTLFLCLFGIWAA